MSAPAYVYEGTIRHRRVASHAHAFRHRLTLLYVDVERVHEVLGGRLVAPSPRPIRFRRADYLGDPARPLADEVRRVVEERTGQRPDGPIRLLTLPRALGHCFNPVSFYFCFDPDDHLGTVLAEVTNTPWGERAAYVLRGAPGEPVLRGETTKRLHVSPFMAMAQTYTWRVTEPGGTLLVHIENRERGRVVFDATLSLRRTPITAAALRRFPLRTIRVTALIYVHALALKLKRVPVHPKPSVAV
ncbi:MAG: DUF1365 domain-containing protein [Solirubrobacterales bacterium]|nr:DUF1365 domain-containing protein [Solirubrobacterales bacterium]